MTIDERCELLAPMHPRDAIRVPWLTDELVATDAARTRLRRWVDAGFPPPPDHAAVGLVGPERGMFDVIERTIERLPPPVRWHVARNVVIVPIGDRARGATDRWPTLFTAGADEALQLVMLAAGPDLDSLTVHEIVHTWLGPILDTPGRTLEAYQQPPDMDALLLEWGAGTRLAVARSEWSTASLARSWGFDGLGAQPEKYAALIRAARRELKS